MIIVGDIGNTETKICLVSSKNIIIKRVSLLTKKINHSSLNKSLLGLNLKINQLTNVYFAASYQKNLIQLKSFLIMFIKLRVTN